MAQGLGIRALAQLPLAVGSRIVRQMLHIAGHDQE